MTRMLKKMLEITLHGAVVIGFVIATIWGGVELISTKVGQYIFCGLCVLLVCFAVGCLGEDW